MTARTARPRRVAGVAGILLSVALSSAGCDNTAAPATTTATPPTTTTTPATGTPGSTTSPVGTTSATAPGDATNTATAPTSGQQGQDAACATRWLAASAQRVEGSAGAGHYGVDVILRNDGSTPCTLQGFPGVSLIDNKGKQLGAAASRDGASASVVLPPGGSGRARVRVTQAGNVGCSVVPAEGLLVYPPGQIQPLMAKLDHLQGCADTASALLQVRSFGA